MKICAESGIYESVNQFDTNFLESKWGGFDSDSIWVESLVFDTI
ncbi:MAG: hypothetical protein SFT68_04535 [Rickettsiaceae bacterium]|nr:hypothetical protein [Rickettsiaceae bacterium]